MDLASPRPLALDGHARPELWPALQAEWRSFLAAGKLAYDPSPSLRFDHELLSFHFLAGRSTRPGADGAGLARGLLCPHSACPFDDPAAMAGRVGLCLERGGRRYHLIANRYPVQADHYLLVRDPSAPAATLGQCLFGAEEIEDVLLFARTLGPPLRFYFNSNAGADGSSSGSSVNHWHFQVLAHRSRAFARLDADGQALAGAAAIAGWEAAAHRLDCDAQPAALAARIWRELERVIALDCAFNLELFSLDSPEGPRCGALLFPRAPLAPRALPGGGELSNRFGGWELSGEVVLYERPAFEWARTHPEEACRFAWRRLQEGTRDLWAPAQGSLTPPRGAARGR